MPPSFKIFIQFIFLKALFLLFSGVAKAESSNNKMSTLSVHNIFENQVKTENKFKFVDFNNLKLQDTVAAESSSPNGSGIPSLRRRPSGGKRFEPKRIPLQIPFPKKPFRASPSITIINPSGFGASWGSAGIGFGFQERVRFQDTADGVIGLGFGLGNSRKNVGVQLGLSLVDVSAPFRDGAINLRLHRRLPKDLSVAIGVQGIVTFGDTDGGSSVFGVATKRFKLRDDRSKPFSEIFTTVGIGGGQFRSESDINNGNETVGIFSSVAVKVLDPVGFVVEWTGQDLTIGAPLVLFRNLPLILVPAITDITGTAGDGTRFIVGFGYSFAF